MLAGTGHCPRRAPPRRGSLKVSGRLIAADEHLPLTLQRVAPGRPDDESSYLRGAEISAADSLAPRLDYDAGAATWRSLLGAVAVGDRVTEGHYRAPAEMYVRGSITARITGSGGGSGSPASSGSIWLQHYHCQPRRPLASGDRQGVGERSEPITGYAFTSVSPTPLRTAMASA